MRRTLLRLISLTAATLCAVSPGRCSYDAFELPPGVEQTRIPRRLPGGDHIWPKVNPADLAAIEGDHVALRVNSRAESLLGYARGELEGDIGALSVFLG